jgi:hypothetical protein
VDQAKLEDQSLHDAGNGRAMCLFDPRLFLSSSHGLIHLNLFARRDLIELIKPPPDPDIASPQLGLI